jgi:hypothetical protein
MKKRNMTALFAGATVLSLAASSQAAWTPIKPAVCNSAFNDLSYLYEVGGLHQKFELPADPNCSDPGGFPCPHYINNVSNTRLFMANGWTTHMQFRLDYLQLEQGFDNITYGPKGFSSSTQLTGLHGASTWWTGLFSQGPSLQSFYNAMRFVSDGSITYGGFTVSTMRICTVATQVDTNPGTLDIGARYGGPLLGTSDVVYAKFTPPASAHSTVALWPADDGSASNDFDIFARCGALPTPSAFDTSATSGNSQEFLHLGACGSSWYLAIVSFRGSGTFNLVVGRHTASHHMTLTAGTDSVFTAAQIQNVSNQLRDSARFFYGVTEGDQYVDTVNLYANNNSGGSNCPNCGNVTGSKCDICFSLGCTPGCVGQTTCAQPPSGQGKIQLWTNGFFYQTIGHEMGHAFYGCLADEYINNTSCGHSIMDDQWNTGTQFNVCTANDHGLDRRPGTTVPVGGAAHTQAVTNGRSLVAPTETPDDYSYVNFDFDCDIGTCAVGNVVRK